MNFLELFKTYQVKGDQSQYSISYIDSENQKEPNRLQEDQAEMHSISLQPKTLSVQLENKMVSNTISKEQIQDLRGLGIDGTEEVKRQLVIGQKINLQKKVLTKCEEVARYKTKYEINQDKGGVKGIRRFFWDLFGYHPEVWIDCDEFFDVLQKSSDEVIRSSRIRTADWIVIHPKAMYRLNQSKDFQSEMSEENTSNGIVSNIGNWRHLKVFVSPSIDKNQILMGRESTSDTDTLVSIVKGEDEWFDAEIVDERSFQTLYNLGLRTPMKVFAIPGSEKSYLRWTFQYEKPSLRRWIWQSIRK